MSEIVSGVYPKNVDSSDLNIEQIAKIHRVAARHLRFMHGIIHRMQILRFPDHDPFWQVALKTRNAVQDFVTACHLYRPEDIQPEQKPVTPEERV